MTAARVRTRPVREAASTPPELSRRNANQRRIQIDENAAPRQIREEIDRAVELPIDAAINRSMQTGRPVPLTPPPPMQVNSDVNTAGLDRAEEGVANRMTLLSEHPNAQREYRLRVLHRMIVRQLSVDIIARALNVSVRQVYNLRDELYRQLREEAANKDLAGYVGYTDAFYNDIIGMAMRMASASETPHARKIGAMNVALQANRDRINFFDTVGFHDVMKITPSSGNYDVNSDRADRLYSLAQNILEGFSINPDEAIDADAAYTTEPGDEDDFPAARLL